MERPPEKIALMHIPKTAGTSISSFIIRELCQQKGYVHKRLENCDENWVPGKPWMRNFTEDEMIAIAQSPEPFQFMRNHTPWTERAFRSFKENGWFVFSFARHPGDVLCSWYFHNLSAYHLGYGQSLDGFVRDSIGSKLNGLIPTYWESLDYIRVFSGERIAEFAAQRLRLPYRSVPYENRSPNLGYEHYCRSGEISSKTKKRLENAEQYRLYLKIKALDPVSVVS